MYVFGVINMKNDEFETPQWLFDELNEEFHFTLDAAANSKNHKCDIWFDKETDALLYDWDEYQDHNAVFMNPPYSRGQLYKWCKKAYEESQKGVTVVGLLPVDTSTKWFHEWIWEKTGSIGFEVYDNPEVRFLPKRLKFCLNGIEQGTARFASMIVIWRGVK
jgi:phage N-6-adenine-methyltransferase